MHPPTEINFLRRVSPLEKVNAKDTGEMAEWSNAAVLKTVDCNRSGGSNPSFSAKQTRNESFGFCIFKREYKYKTNQVLFDFTFQV